MSDFDKEAEREKLREKYEEEQREREATEKMSELLLQGATMTNAHCSDCGDPIFRYEGQEFCASCEKAVDRGSEEAEQDESDSDTSEGSEDAENIEVTSPDDGARVAFGGENADAEGNGDQSSDPTQQPAGSQPQSADSPHQHSSPPQQQSPGGQHSPSQPSRQRQPTQEVPGVDPGEAGAERRSANSRAASQPDADVSAARESLVRTLTRFSQQAEATDDPQRAQEYLAAARDAAEALSALRR